MEKIITDVLYINDKKVLIYEQQVITSKRATNLYILDDKNEKVYVYGYDLVFSKPVYFTSIEFTDCEFRYCEFVNCNFFDCSFVSCVFHKCSFIDCESLLNCKIYNEEIKDYIDYSIYKHS